MKRGLATVFGLMVVTVLATGCSEVIGNRTGGAVPGASVGQGTQETLRDFEKWHEKAHKPGGA